jgi:hypothetical protein
MVIYIIKFEIAPCLYGSGYSLDNIKDQVVAASGGTAPRILKVAVSMRKLVSFTPQPLYLHDAVGNRIPFYWPSSPYPSHYTDWAIPGLLLLLLFSLSRGWVATDGVWIGNWIYWPLTVTASNYIDVANSHTQQFTTASTKRSQSAVRSPVVAW